MIRVPRKMPKRQMETTISLINIVFLMLIFFLVAGQLSPPADPEVTLSEAESAPPLPPPDALYARSDGSLLYWERPVSPAAYLADRGEDESGTYVELAADADLPASKLLQHVDALYAAGAKKIVIVTRNVSQ